MNTIKSIFLLLLFVLFWDCSSPSPSPTEKHQNKRNNVLNVHEKVKEINTGDVFISSVASLYIIGDYLMIVDHKSLDEYVNVFDKNTFKYRSSMIPRGQGPGEITRIGNIGYDEKNNILYAVDLGKTQIFSYPLDSILSDPNYTPTARAKMSEKVSLFDFKYINDSLYMGITVQAISNSDFTESTGIWNINTGEITPMKYTRLNTIPKRVYFDVSIENGLYVECYQRVDLLTICTLDGGLKYNVYGRDWYGNVNRVGDNQIRYYDGVAFCGDKILAAYVEKPAFYDDKKRGRWASVASKFLVFDLNGNYIKTLELGYDIVLFCYDKDNNRVLMLLNDEEIQFAYLDLDGLI